MRLASALAIGTLNPGLIASQILRKKGVITEGYNLERDRWEKSLNLGGIAVVMGTRDFKHPNIFTVSAGNGKTVKTPPKWKLMRMGMKPMYFGSKADLLARIKQVYEREGYDTYPSAPFMFHNQHTGKYTLMSPERIEALRGLSYRGVERTVGPATLPFPG